jgi:hypothetical protein
MTSYLNQSVSAIPPAPENATNLEYDYNFNTRTGLLGGNVK